MITKQMTITGSPVTNGGTGYATSEQLTSDFRNVTIQVNLDRTSGAAAGVFKVQGSSDNTNWTDIASATATVTDVADQTLVVLITDKIFPYYRVNYTGTGTMVVAISSAFISLGK